MSDTENRETKDSQTEQKNAKQGVRSMVVIRKATTQMRNHQVILLR